MFGCPTSFIGVGQYSDIEAGGNLVDVLDASGGEKGVVFVNVAPRHGEGRAWSNGSPFAFFWYKKTLIVATISGRTLSLAKKLLLLNHVNLLDAPVVLDAFVKQGILPPASREHIVLTQFRSFDFLPYVAKALMERKMVPSKTFSAGKIEDIPPVVWWVDNFGNCKTTLLKEDIKINNGIVVTKMGNLSYCEQLKDVPDGEAAIVRGSSGIGGKRFLEIVLQGGSAAQRFSLAPGSAVL
jgi:hypothetical protein